MFFEKYPITKLFFNVKRKEKKNFLKVLLTVILSTKCYPTVPSCITAWKEQALLCLFRIGETEA